jgi:hypothetical protein
MNDIHSFASCQRAAAVLVDRLRLLKLRSWHDTAPFDKRQPNASAPLQ